MAQVKEVIDPANPHRVLFSGSDDQARDFVEQHAPRTHSDAGHEVPLLVLRNEGGGGEEYFNGEWKSSGTGGPKKEGTAK